jgi:hypothetical protein
MSHFRNGCSAWERNDNFGSFTELGSGLAPTLLPHRRLSTFDGRPTNRTSDTEMGDYGINLLKGALGSGSGLAAGKSTSRPFKKKNVPSLAQYIQSDACQNIYLMVISSRNSFRGLREA